MQRISLAFRSFFQILFGGKLSPDVAAALGYAKKQKPPPPPPPAPTAADGACQILGILQNEGRLIDFLLEDISAYTDDQVGAAVRNVHEQGRAAIARHFKLTPVIDGVEGTYAKAAEGANTVKFVGKVPAGPPPKGGTLRHRGWRAERVDLPSLGAKKDTTILAPAEIEIE